MSRFPGPLQTAFWDGLRELEILTGLEIDGTQELGPVTMETLVEADAEEVNRGI